MCCELPSFIGLTLQAMRECSCSKNWQQTVLRTSDELLSYKEKPGQLFWVKNDKNTKTHFG